MAGQPWLKVGDQILLDGGDFRVVELLVGRADRLSFRRITASPQLGGEQRMLLQLEEALLEARPLDPGKLAGERVELDAKAFELRWDSELLTERSAQDKPVKFGRGRCAWYEADDGAVALLVVERYDRDAFVAVPLAASRVDLRFTGGLRGRG